MNDAPAGALADPRLLAMLARIDATAADGAGALVFGPSDNPTGLILIDRARICWATSSSIPGRLRRIVVNETDDLAGALRAAKDVLRRYSVGDAALGTVLVEHCSEAVQDVSAMAGEPTWVERSRTYDAKFSIRPCQVFAGLSRINNAAAVDTAARVLEAVESTASAVAIARPSSGLSPRILCAVDGAGIGVERLVALAQWGEIALPATGAFLRGANLTLYESRQHGTTATWMRGGTLYVGWAPDGRALASVLSNNGLA